MPEPILLPCPFCGSTEVRLHSGCLAYVIYYVCGASGPWGWTEADAEAEAVRLWNTRQGEAQAGEKGT